MASGSFSAPSLIFHNIDFALLSAVENWAVIFITFSIITPRPLSLVIIAGSETNYFSWQALLCILEKWMSSAILEVWHFNRWFLKALPVSICFDYHELVSLASNIISLSFFLQIIHEHMEEHRSCRYPSLQSEKLSFIPNLCFLPFNQLFICERTFSIMT